MFIILSGSSGVGKNTIINEMQKTNEKLVLMPTFTTREMREGEVSGNPFFYISKTEFQEKIKNNELIEHELIHGNFYGSSHVLFDEYIKGGNIIIKDIGVEGAQNLSLKLADKTKILKIFLTVNSKSELKKRLKGRGEKQIKLRLKRFKYEQQQMNKFDYIIFNMDMQKTVDIIKTIANLEQNDFYFEKEISKYNSYKIKYYINKLNSKKVLSPVKVTISNNKAYVVSDAEKLIASFLSGQSVAKLVVEKQKNFDTFTHIFDDQKIK